MTASAFMAVNEPAALLGIVVGAVGILYGLKARHFSSFGFGVTTKRAEKIEPRWQDRALVITISAVVLIASIAVLISNR